jgi:hypothetical protein
MRELGAESDVGDGDIVQNEVEPSCTLHQVVSNESRHLDELLACPTIQQKQRGSHILSLSDQLTGVELRNDTLQDFVDDRWQYALVVVGSEFSVDRGKVSHGGSREHSAGDVDLTQR